MPLLQAGGDFYFNINGESKSRGEFDLVNPDGGDQFGIVYRGTAGLVFYKGCDMQHYSSWESSLGVPFPDADALRTAFQTFFF